MKDEIKEILEDNDELMVRYKDNSFECFDTLPKNVLDYITNLQEENERLNMVVTIQEDYKSKNEKAIEYINTHNYPTDKGVFETDLDKRDLKNILKGDNK